MCNCKIYSSSKQNSPEEGDLKTIPSRDLIVNINDSLMLSAKTSMMHIKYISNIVNIDDSLMLH